MLVYAGVTLAKEEVHRCGPPVAASTSAHLVELDRAKGHVVEHHISNVGQVDALAKGAGTHDAGELARTEGLLHLASLITRESGIVKRDAPA